MIFLYLAFLALFLWAVIKLDHHLRGGKTVSKRADTSYFDSHWNCDFDSSSDCSDSSSNSSTCD